MIKYTVMKFLVIALAFLASSVHAAKNVLPRPGDEGYADSEASTNEVFAVGAMSENRFRLTLEMGALTNNTVAVEFGKDGNSDGKLSCDEIDLSLCDPCSRRASGYRQRKQRPDDPCQGSYTCR